MISYCHLNTKFSINYTCVHRTKEEEEVKTNQLSLCLIHPANVLTWINMQCIGYFESEKLLPPMNNVDPERGIQLIKCSSSWRNWSSNGSTARPSEIGGIS